MDALDLDRDGYSGTYKLIGGRVSLDFVNTVSWPGAERQHDWFSSIENVKSWARASKVPSPSLTSADLPQICDTRSLLAAVLRPLSDHGAKTSDVIAPLNSVLRSAASRRVIDEETLAWSWADQAPIEALLDPVVIDAAALVTTAALTRLKQCPACQWLFEDQTRNGRRRWCDMADCGSRAKSKAHYHRTKDRPR